MARTQDVPAGADRRRLHRSAALHGLAVVIFGLMTWRGIDVVVLGSEAMGVPMLITGAAGTTGALVIVWSLLRRRNPAADARTPGRLGAQGAARIGMAVAALATVVVGVALAPAGWERGFVISVNTITGALLAVFALLAGERAARQSGAG